MDGKAAYEWARKVRPHGDTNDLFKERTGITWATVTSWRRGASPSADSIITIAQKYGASPVQALIDTGIIDADEAAPAPAPEHPSPAPRKPRRAPVGRGWMDWIDGLRATKNHGINDFTRYVGLSRAGYNTWARKVDTGVSPEPSIRSILAVARAYNVNPLDGIVAAGYATAEEAESWIDDRTGRAALAHAPAEAILEELEIRLKARRSSQPTTQEPAESPATGLHAVEPPTDWETLAAHGPVDERETDQ